MFTGGSFPGGKRWQGHESDLSPTTVTKANKTWIYTTSCGNACFKHRDNFTYIFLAIQLSQLRLLSGCYQLLVAWTLFWIVKIISRAICDRRLQTCRTFTVCLRHRPQFCSSAVLYGVHDRSSASAADHIERSRTVAWYLMSNILISSYDSWYWTWHCNGRNWSSYLYNKWIQENDQNVNVSASVRCV